MTSFPAFTVGKVDGQWTRTVTELSTEQLPPGEVLIRVEYSGINYKDGLAASESGRVARIDPLVPGVDLAGVVLESSTDHVAVGDHVIVHGYDLGVAHHGGFAAEARVPAGWVVPMPGGLSAKQAMMIGTAGFTAAKSVAALESRGLRPGDGPVLVTGATGGVGSIAVGILAHLGFEVVASSGKAESRDWLLALGASDVIGRDETSAESKRPLETERWAACVDCVGGSTLAYAARTMRYGASIAASGLTGGAELHTTVMPFILRGVNLLGIDSVQTPVSERTELWRRMAADLRPPQIDGDDADSVKVVGLGELSVELDKILQGGMVGRVLVDPSLSV